MTALLSFLKGFFVDLIVTAGMKIWQLIRKGDTHHESKASGSVEKDLNKKIEDKWGDEA